MVQNLKIQFHKNPFAFLLIFLDSCQEEGRESGDRQGEWAENCEEELDLNKKQYKLTFQYTHEDSTPSRKCNEDLIKKAAKISDTFENHLKCGALGGYKIIIKGTFKFDKNISPKYIKNPDNNAEDFVKIITLKK